MAHDVFISHSSKDKVTADAICHALEKNGVRCWIAPRDVRPGKTYGAEIIESIEECSIFVLLFSKNSNDSEDVKNEVHNAFSSKKTIIPCRLDDTQMDNEMKYFLSRKHWIDAYPGDTGLDELLITLKNALGHGGNVAGQPAATHSNTAEANHPDIAIGDVIPFGPYDWRVLDVQADRALLITNDIVEYRPYHHEQIDMTWAECDLRTYLNEEFYESKFSAEEKERILTVNNRNPGTCYRCADGKTPRATRGGRNTEDRVFLLSIPEAVKYFNMSYMPSKEFYADSDWKDWLVVVPENLPYSYDAAVGTWWFLRSGGFLQYSLAFVADKGEIGYNGAMYVDYGVRPALWLKLD